MVKERLQAWLRAPNETPAPALPVVEAPSLSGLVVEVSAPPEITREALLARYEAFVRQASPRRPRAGGEKVGAGDEVLIDVVGTAGGHVLPLSAHQGLWVEALPNPPLAAFGPSLVGLTVGARSRVDLMLPFDYPVVALRGEIATFDVEVRAATEVRTLDPSAPDFIPTLNRGETLDQVMRSLLDEMQAEAAQSLRQQVLDKALDLLRERAPIEIPTALLDEELWRRWAAHEGPLLLARGLDEDELHRAQDAWVQHPGLRADAARRLHISLVLGAIALRDGIAPTHENIAPYLEAVASEMGLTLDQAREALRQDPGQAAVVLQQIHHLLVVDHVLARVEVRKSAG